ncbi:MAG: hypothetical protein IPL78_27070 [Chloroflexi bacterium]|nr:hypothetical protein [Chloroflexota bacterium]
MSRKHRNQDAQLHHSHLRSTVWFWLWLALLGLTACGRDENTTPTVPVTTEGVAPTIIVTAANPPALTEPLPTDPPTPVPATPTTAPLVATVNGHPILLSTFEAELALYTPPAKIRSCTGMWCWNC